MNKSLIKKTFVTAALMACGSLLPSCVSSEPVEPPVSITEKGDQITLRFSAPKALETRADANFKLRYVAKLYERQGLSIDPSTMVRKDMIEGGEDGTVIVFQVDPDKIYEIHTFADYIPSYSTVQADGTYPDYYYNTRTDAGNVSMIVNPGSSTRAITEEFFNNDNYDCFARMDTVHKTKLKKELKCELQRAVAKVRFVDESATPESFGSLTFSALSFFPDFNITTLQRGAYSTLKQWDIEQLNLTAMGNAERHEVFYFYTFASSSRDNLKAFRFTTVNSAGQQVSRYIQDYEVPVMKNYVTTIKGKLVADLPSQDEPDDPKEEDLEGGIILDLTTNPDWNSPDFTPDISF